MIRPRFLLLGSLLALCAPSLGDTVTGKAGQGPGSVAAAATAGNGASSGGGGGSGGGSGSGGAGTDTDGDGIPDNAENNGGTDPTKPDADEDPDHDGLTNGDEYAAGTYPWNPYSDGDSLNDGDDAVPTNGDMTVHAAPEASYVIIDLGTAASAGESLGLDDQGEVLLMKPNPDADPNTAQPFFRGQLWKAGTLAAVADANNFFGPLNDGSVYYAEPGVYVPDSYYGGRSTSVLKKKPAAGSATADGYDSQAFSLHSQTDGQGNPITAYEPYALMISEPMTGLFKAGVEAVSQQIAGTPNWEYYYNGSASVVGMNDAGIKRLSAYVTGQTSSGYERNVWLAGWKSAAGACTAAGTQAHWNYRDPNAQMHYPNKYIDPPQINSASFAVSTRSDYQAGTSEGVIFQNSSTPVTIPGSTAAWDVTEKTTPEGPYIVGFGNSGGKLWAYKGGNFSSVDLGISPTGGSNITTRGLSNSLVIPAGDSIWRNSRIRKIADLAGHPADWSDFYVRFVSPNTNLLLADAKKAGVLHRVLLVPITLTLLNGKTHDIDSTSIVTAIIPSPENPKAANDQAAEGMSTLGELPMGAGRAESPNNAYTNAIMVSAKAPLLPPLTYKWERLLTRRSWYIQLNSTGTRWTVTQRSKRGVPSPADDTDIPPDFSNNVPSAQKNEFYEYDCSALGYDYPNDKALGFMKTGDYIHEEKAFTYKVKVSTDGSSWTDGATMDVGQIITIKYKGVGGTAATDWIGIENSNQNRTLTPTINFQKVRAIVGGTLPIDIDPNANN